jgi:predicted ABC-type ATPase
MNESNPQVVVIAGPNGAGKSTLAPFLLRDTFGLLEFVNADTISAGLSAFNSDAVALDAGRVMLSRLRELAKNRQSFSFETTLATRSYASWLGRLKQTGYEFHLFFLWLSTAELAIQRVSDRVRRGGHFVSENVVRRRYGRSLNNLFDLYAPLADTWAVYDNSAHGSPILVATGEPRVSPNIIRPDLWRPLAEGRS